MGDILYVIFIGKVIIRYILFFCIYKYRLIVWKLFVYIYMYIFIGKNYIFLYYLFIILLLVMMILNLLIFVSLNNVSVVLWGIFKCE